MKQLVLILLIASLSACASDMRARSDHDRAQSFAGYRTYAWIADEPMLGPRDEVDRVSPLNRQRIVEAIEAQLQSRGFSKVANPDAASFTVAYTVGSRDRIDVFVMPEVYRHPWTWGRPYFGSEVDAATYTEGTLAIDIFDGASKRPVWHGWISKRISEKDVERAAVLIPPAVQAVLAGFPPK